MNRSIAAAFLTTLAICPLANSAPEGAKPPPVLVRSPAPRMQWRMTISSDKGPERKPEENGPDSAALAVEAESAPKEFKAIDFTRSNDLTRAVVTYNRGSAREIWRFGSYVLDQMPSNHRIYVNRENPTVDLYAYTSPEFYGIKNVQPAHDQGEVMFEKLRCRHYVGDRQAFAAEIQLVSTGAVPPSSVPYEAWFDVTTGFPRGYREKGKTFVFQITPDPPADLRLPAEWQAAWEKFRLDLRRNGAPR